MKLPLLLAAGVLSAPLLPSVSAAIPIAGPGTHTENFDTLPTAGARVEFTWVDDQTVPGFYLHRSNGNPSLAGSLTTAGSRPYISDGSQAATTTPNFHGFLSLGTYGDTDRALGSSPTTNDGSTNWAGGTLSTIALYTNTSAAPLDLSQLAYDIEAWRANSVATNIESITVTYKVGTAAALLAELGTSTASALFAQGYADLDLTLNHFAADGFTALASGARTLSLSSTLTERVRVLPGQSIAIRWGNTNDNGADAQVGIDNLSVTFIAVADAVIAPAVANVVRTDNPGSADPLQDTCSFDLTVTGTGPVSSAGWIITAPAALAGTTGSYGTTQTISGLPVILAGLTTGHTVAITVADASDSSVTGTAVVTVPWCSITAAALGAPYNDGGTLGAEDDTLSIELSASGQWTGANYTISNGGLLLSTQPYGAASIPALPGGNYSLTFSDELDADCRANLTVHAPGPIGENALQAVSLPILSALATGERAWTMNTAGRTMTQNAATQVDHVVESQEINIAGIAGVEVSAQLIVQTGGSSGFEAADHFALDLIIDGGAPVSMLGSYDVDADGLLEGAASNGLSSFVELPDAGDTDSQIIYGFSRVIPPGASTLKIRITGNSNSSAETFIFENLRLTAAGSSLQAALAGPVTIDNRGTVDPADDMLSAPVNITPIGLGASTGWNAGLNAPDGPGTGLYADANPVIFFLQLPQIPETTRLLSIHDNLNNLAAATLTIPVPARAFSATLATVPNIVRNENGPGVEDDTVSFDMTIRGPNGGPEFGMATGMGTATAASYSLTATDVTHTVTLSAPPSAGGPVVVRVFDTSYRTSAANIVVQVPPATTAAAYVIGRTFFGAPADLLSEPNPPAAWQNNPALRTLILNNSGALTTIRSTVIDLTAVGEVSFTASLRSIDTSTGFEDSDRFLAHLIIDGDPLQRVSLTTFTENDAIEGLNGFELGSPGGSPGFPIIFGTTLRGTVPATANSVQLEISAITNSNSELLLLEDVKFAPAAPAITPGSAAMNVNIGTSGKMRASALVARATGGTGPLSVSAVQSAATLLGGRVSLEEGWVVYEAAPGAVGLDSFTYTLTDGVNPVEGTVVVIIGVPEGATMNVAGVIVDGNTAHVAGFGIPGRTYRWEYSPNLTEWLQLGEPAVCPAHGAMSVTDPGPLPFRRYYRLAEMPANP